LVMMCVSRRVIFLNDCAGARSFTFLCKRKQLWYQNLLLVPPPVNTALLCISPKLAGLLIPSSSWLNARELTKR
jgi:hypothetical protein